MADKTTQKPAIGFRNRITGHGMEAPGALAALAARGVLWYNGFMEKWKAIPGFEGLYEVSACGEVRRIGKGCGAKIGRILKAQYLPAGYLICGLWKGNRGVMRLVHRLVALAFLGPCPAGQEVNHKNYDKADNRVENLEYLTRSENLCHRVSAGIGRGERNGQAKLQAKDVLTIREEHQMGRGYKQLGKKYGVTWGAIRNIIKKRTWVWLERADA